MGSDGLECYHFTGEPGLLVHLVQGVQASRNPPIYQAHMPPNHGALSPSSPWPPRVPDCLDNDTSAS